jgi:rRNA maturation endonuclease Nob1
MCYPCSGCNGCGKMDSKLFSYMIPRLRCMNCGMEYHLGEDACTECGWELPKPPGEREGQGKEQAEIVLDNIRRS